MKSIIFCADGTWNGSDADDDGDGHPDVTNVARLFSLLQGSITADTLRLQDEQEKQVLEPGPVGQVAKYMHGVGDSRNPIKKMLGGVFGAGLITRIVRGYTYISRHYEPGDRIFIAGFSRGAYTARALAGLISAKGLLAPMANDDRELAYRKGAGAWAAYRQGAGFSTSWLDMFSGEGRAGDVSDADFIPGVKIAAVAVWDTVGSYGAPIYNPANLQRFDVFKFANTTLSGQVLQGFHAVSVDERRIDFVPTLWDQRKDVDQVLFAGAHADVGGGYPKEQLALVSLDWMVRKLKAAGALFAGSVASLPTEFAAIDTHSPWDEHPFKAFPNRPRDHPPGILIHPSVQSLLDARAAYMPESLRPFMTGRRVKPEHLSAF